MGKRLKYEINCINPGQFSFSITDINETNRKIDFEIYRLFDTVYDINIRQGDVIAKIATVELYSGAFYQIISRQIKSKYFQGGSFEWYQYADQISSLIGRYIQSFAGQ